MQRIGWTRAALVLGVVLAVAVAHRFGVLAAFSSPARAKATLVGLGGSGQLAFVVAYTLLQPFGVPGTVFVMAAPLVWPWPVAFALSMTGTMTASVVGFSFARYVGRDAVASRLPERVRRYEELLEKRAFATVAFLRFLFWMPQWLHVFLGVSNVRFSTHFWASLVGYAVPLFVVSYFGERIFEILRGLSAGAWIGIGLGTVTFFAAAWLFSRQKK